ncbi:MAG: response regulator transcription factor [Anaerolineae bacterium]
MAVKILLVGSEPEISAVSQGVADAGYDVLVAHNFEEALSQVRSESPDSIILDATLENLDGRRACRALRRRVPGGAIILIIAQGEEFDGSLPVDAYLEKPFSLQKLLDSLEKVLARRLSEVLRQGDLIFDTRARCVIRKGRKHKLTPRQARLLEVFMRNAGQVLSRKFLMKHVWDTDFLDDTRTLDVHVRWVREKIEDNPSSPLYLRTVRGIGYRFDAEGEESTSEPEGKSNAGEEKRGETSNL